MYLFQQINIKNLFKWTLPIYVFEKLLSFVNCISKPSTRIKLIFHAKLLGLKYYVTNLKLHYTYKNTFFKNDHLARSTENTLFLIHKSLKKFKIRFCTSMFLALIYFILGKNIGRYLRQQIITLLVYWGVSSLHSVFAPVSCHFLTPN